MSIIKKKFKGKIKKGIVFLKKAANRSSSKKRKGRKEREPVAVSERKTEGKREQGEWRGVKQNRNKNVTMKRRA